MQAGGRKNRDIIIIEPYFPKVHITWMHKNNWEVPGTLGAKYPDFLGYATRM
jgi:hypothetical protein